MSTQFIYWPYRDVRSDFFLFLTRIGRKGALPLPNALYGAACVTGYHNWATEEFARVLFGEAVMLPNDEVFDDVVTLA